MITRLSLLIALLSAALPSSAQQFLVDSLHHDGVWRNYRIYLPAGFNAANPAPLVLNFHGYGSNALEQEFYSGFDAVADTAGVVVAYPNGIDNAFEPFTTSDDVGFTDALITKLHQQYNVDLDRVYSTGMSNGGFFSVVLACQLTHRLAAIANVAGSMVIGAPTSCDPSETIPVLHIHGTADNVVPYPGNIQFIPVPSVLNFWAAENGCSTSPTTTPLPNVSTTDGTTADLLEYPDCTGNRRVVHIRVNNGGHTWPGAAFSIGVTSQDFKASVEIWRFFRQYSRNSVATQEAVLEGIAASPNPVHEALRIDLGPHDAVDVRIINAGGQVVYNVANQRGSFEVAVGAFPPGIYRVECRTRQAVRSINIIKV